MTKYYRIGKPIKEIPVGERISVHTRLWIKVLEAKGLWVPVKFKSINDASSFATLARKFYHKDKFECRQRKTTVFVRARKKSAE